MGKYEYEMDGHRIEYGVEVQIAELRIDPQAQRSLNERRAQQIADNFVEEAVGSIVVSSRVDGGLYVVDGMHRKRACELLGHKVMFAEVHHDLTVRDEATLFLIRNRESNKPAPLDNYKVGITAGLPLFIDTETVLRRHALTVGSKNGPHMVKAVASVLRITETHGPDILDRTLGVAEAAWGREARTWDGVILAGLGEFLGRHGDDVDDQLLAMKLARKGGVNWWFGRISQAASLGADGALQGSGTGSRLIAGYRLILAAWNSGRRKNRLGE